MAAGANTNVSVTANATGLAVGSYSANVCVATNDPANALTTIPVTLTVTQGAFVPCSAGADEIFCDGFEGTGGGGGPGVYQDRTEFLTHVAAGYYENAFDDLSPSSGPEAALHYTDAGSGIAYTVDTLPDGDDLWNGPGIVSTNGSADQIIITFTGSPVTAVGGNFYASDIDVAPIAGNSTGPIAEGVVTSIATPVSGDTVFRLFMPNQQRMERGTSDSSHARPAFWI